MTSPFERFTRPSDAFEKEAIALQDHAYIMADEDPNLTIAFMLAGTVRIAMAHEISPEALVNEFKKLLTAFRWARKTADELYGPETEH